MQNVLLWWWIGLGVGLVTCKGSVCACVFRFSQPIYQSIHFSHRFVTERHLAFI